MATAGVITAFGIGLGLLGMLQPDLYDVAAMVTFLGLMGLVIRGGGVLRSRKRTFAGPGDD